MHIFELFYDLYWLRIGLRRIRFEPFELCIFYNFLLKWTRKDTHVIKVNLKLEK